MARLWLILCIVVMLDMAVDVNSLRRPRKPPKRPKKPKIGSVANQIASLEQNLTSLWSEVKEMGSSRVNVHVHGMDHDEDSMQKDEDGTHVHIHMHAEGPMGHMHHMGGHDHQDGGQTVHGFHGSPMKMKSGGRKMMKFMHEHMHFPDEDTYVYGHCEMMMNPTLKKSPHEIKGAVHFRQKMHGPLEMIIHLKGFHVPKGVHSDHSAHTHGFHVHQFADLTNGCQSFGGHFDPDGVDHSAKSSHSRHAGDWGNIMCDDAGEVHMNTNDTMAALIGTHSILGRGIVIHEHADDLGLGGVEASLKTGNAGGRLACCVVAWADEHEWNTLVKHQH